MREEVKNKLLSDYNSLSFKQKSTCVKYHYKYNDVNVNIYFDSYDENSIVFSTILSYDKNYYFTPLNIANNMIRKEYLSDIPTEVLTRILVDNKLDNFFADMELHILTSEPIISTYNKDKIFSTTVTIQKKNIDLPFWYHIRHVRMADRTVEELCERADITRKTLEVIQEKNMTLVRTDDPLKRKKITMILNDVDLELVKF